MALGLPSGTQSVTLFSRMSKRVSWLMKSRPSSLPEAAPASSWFICFWPAEMKTSQSAPSWIWVLRVPDESKLKLMSAPSLAALKRSPASVSDSVSEAAAKTVNVLGSAVDAVPVAAEPVVWAWGCVCLPPHATSPRPAAATAADTNERLVMLEPAIVLSFPSV